MCKNLTEALMEDVIEITWMFDALMQDKLIPSWDELVDNNCGSDGIKQEIREIAYQFEEKYPYDTTWEDGELDYIIEIEKFAKEELLKRFNW